jgi:hypothetical protein
MYLDYKMVHIHVLFNEPKKLFFCLYSKPEWYIIRSVSLFSFSLSHSLYAIDGLLLGFHYFQLNGT